MRCFDNHIISARTDIEWSLTWNNWNKYTVSQKGRHHTLGSYLHQIFTDFKYSFTAPIFRTFATRKASCRWQTRATLAKRLHGICKSSAVVSCVASLPIDSLPMVSCNVLYSNCVCKMRRFGDTRLLKLPWPWNPGQGVTQGHRNWHHSIACLWFPITVP